MADPASILAFASGGLKLSFTLYSFAAALGSAGKEMGQTAKDISLFASVLKQFGVKMKQAQQAGYVANEAFELTNEIIRECQLVFNDLNAMIDKATTTEKIKVVKMKADEDEVKVEDRDNLTVSYGRRLLYLFKKAEIVDRKNRLDSLKSSLQLMLALMTFTENARSFTSNKSKNPKEFDAWMAEENLELESLVLANQAAASDFRKLKAKPLLKRNSPADEDKVAKFGVMGQLMTPKSDQPPQSQAKATNKAPGPEGESKIAAELDSTSIASKMSFISSLGTYKSHDAEPAIVVVPSPLTFTSNGNIAPYQSISPMSAPYALRSSSQPPSQNQSQPPNKQPTQNPAKGAEPSKLQPLGHTSTPSAVVSMLVTRMTTGYQKPTVEDDIEEEQSTPSLAKTSGAGRRNEGNEGKNEGASATTEAHGTVVEDEDEPVIDLFPRRAPRPY